jgi:hypothetical protein
MKQLLILGPNASFAADPAYRGTEHRITPYYHTELDENHEVNRWHQWLVVEGGETGVVSDLEMARQLVAAYNNLPLGEHFEIVEIVRGKSESYEGEGDFLGYDLSYGLGNSLLADDLSFSIKQETLGQNRELRTIVPILALIESYFRPQLNTHRLFNDYDTAVFCLECMDAVSSCSPGIFEYGKYEVVGLFQITS